MDKTKFSLSYLIFGEGGKDWWKAIGAFVKLAILAVLIYGGFSAWNYFFPKPTSQRQDINVARGANATINVQNISKDKKAFIPFVEGGAEARDNEKIGAFLRVGVRLEF